MKGRKAGQAVAEHNFRTGFVFEIHVVQTDGPMGEAVTFKAFERRNQRKENLFEFFGIFPEVGNFVKAGNPRAARKLVYQGHLLDVVRRTNRNTIVNQFHDMGIVD